MKIYEKNYNQNILKLYNILMQENIKESINNNLEYLLNLIPEIKNIIGFNHNNPHHHLDVWEHTLYALSISEINFDLRLALLLHDIGKPYTCTTKNGINHFYNHPFIGAQMTKNILTKIGFCNEYIEKIYYLVLLHDTPIKQSDIKNNYDLTYIRYLIQEYDVLAHHPEKLEKRIKYLESTKKLILKK